MTGARERAVALVHQLDIPDDPDTIRVIAAALIAAREAGIEEAAKVADAWTVMDGEPPMSTYARAARSRASAIANALRDLINPKERK